MPIVLAISGASTKSLFEPIAVLIEHLLPHVVEPGSQDALLESEGVVAGLAHQFVNGLRPEEESSGHSSLTVLVPPNLVGEES
jgi:hypothetical protein